MKKIGVEEVVKKLTLWHTATFRPIISHDDLEPIMASAGFFPLPFKPNNHNSATAATTTTTTTTGGSAGGGGHVAWREYEFGGKSVGGPHHHPLRPRLPYPRVDGVHLLAYKAFFHALEFYLGPQRVSDLFHVRSMPVTKAQDRVFDGKLRPMKDCNMGDDGIFVYRDGTLDHITQMVCSDINIVSSPISSSKASSNSSSSSICLVPLEDLFPGPSRDIVSLG